MPQSTRNYARAYLRGRGSRNAVSAAFKRGVVKERKRHGHIMNTKLTVIDTITAGAGGTWDVVYNLHNPAITKDGAGTAATDWTGFTALYDQYRVRAIRLQFIPSQPNADSTTALFAPFFLVYDKDSETALTSDEQALVATDHAIKNLYRPWKYYRKLRKIGPKDQDMPGGWIDCANPHTQGAIKTYMEGVGANESYGKVMITYYVQFKNRI